MKAAIMALVFSGALLLPPLHLPLSAAGADQEPEKERVVALVNGQVITATQLDAELQPQLTQLEEQARKLRQTMLSKLIDNHLLEEAAAKERVSLAEYMRRHIEEASVSDQEVEDAYQRSRERYAGALAPEAKYRIRRGLEDSRRADAERRLLTELRRQAVVRNYLIEARSAGLSLAGPGAPVRGDEAATVTIVEFSDFECPYCHRAQPLLRKVLDEWPGQVRVVFRHFPLSSHRNAFNAAIAGVCADRQGRFWEVHDELFDEGRDLGASGVAALAAKLGLDERGFSECMKDPSSAQRVRQDMELGRKAGVDGTPVLFVNGRRIANPDALRSVVEQEVRKQKVGAAPVP